MNKFRKKLKQIKTKTKYIIYISGISIKYFKTNKSKLQYAFADIPNVIKKTNKMLNKTARAS